MPDSKSGTPGADTYKVKGNIHWVSVAHALAGRGAALRPLFGEAMPDAGGRDAKLALNPDSCRVIRAQLEPSLRAAQAGQCCQFERHGYFVADRVDSRAGLAGVQSRVALKDSWGGAKKR